MRHPSSGGIRIRDHKDIAEMDEKNDDDETNPNNIKLQQNEHGNKPMTGSPA
jgi:hypothetical protein